MKVMKPHKAAIEDIKQLSPPIPTDFHKKKGNTVCALQSPKGVSCLQQGRLKMLGSCLTD